MSVSWLQTWDCDSCVQTPEFRIRSPPHPTPSPWLELVVGEGWEGTWASFLSSWPRKGCLSMTANPSSLAPQLVFCTNRPPSKAPTILMDPINVAAVPHNTKPFPSHSLDYSVPTGSSCHLIQILKKNTSIYSLWRRGSHFKPIHYASLLKRKKSKIKILS